MNKSIPSYNTGSIVLKNRLNKRTKSRSNKKKRDEEENIMNRSIKNEML